MTHTDGKMDLTDNEEAEFHKFWDQLCDEGYKDVYEAARSSWKEAKKKMPVVKLPDPIIATKNMESRIESLCYMYGVSDCIDAIKEAGIPYIRNRRDTVTIPERINQLVLIHQGLRSASRATGVDAGYLKRLRDSEKSNPSEETLGKLGIRKEVNYVLQ